MSSDASSLKMAVWQTASVPGDVEANLAALDAAAERAKNDGVELLITPEMYVTGYNIGPGVLDLAAAQPLERVGEIAARHGIGIIAGGPEQLEIQAGEVGQAGVANAAWFFGDDGEILARHHKIQLFGDGDQSLFEAGHAPVTMANYRGLNVAMLICFDVEYPEAVRAAAQAGADLVAVPTGNMAPYSFVNEHVIRVRAWENTVFVAYANHVGTERDFDYVGLSVIADPLGMHVAQAGPVDVELITATIDTAVIGEARHTNTYLAELRSELFNRRP